MLLCAGLGTRLRPLTLERPKPLVPLLGRPLAAYALDRLAAVGVRHVVANTFHLGEQVERTLTPFVRAHDMTLRCVHEQTLLGTGGGIRNALSCLGDEPFIVFNGDVLAAPDIARALAVHRASNARMTMILRHDPRADALGAIEVDDEGRVRRVLGEGPTPEVAVTRCMFTGVYVLSPDIREDLPDVGCIVRHSLRRWLARGDRVSAVIDRGQWFDLGTIDAYAQATFGLLDGSVALEGVECSATRQRVAASARFNRAKLTLGDYVDVGDEAQIDGEGVLSRSIVWDRAQLAAPASNVIVTTGGARVAIA